MRNVIELKSLFNSDDFKEDIITRVLEKYKDKTVEKRIKVSRNLDYIISRNLDYIIRTENIDCGKLLEKAVKDYLALKY